PVDSRLLRAITANEGALQRRAGKCPSFIGSFGRPIVPDPADEAFLADFTGGKSKNDRRCLRGIRGEHNAVPAQEHHHRHEGDTLVAVDEGVILSESKRIGGRQLGQRRLLISPLVDRALQRRSQHAFIAQSRSTAKTAELAAMDCNGLLVGNPDRLMQLAHLASVASVSRYFSIISSAISIVRSKSGSWGVSIKPPPGCSTTNSRSPSFRSRRAAVSFGKMKPIELPIF